MTLNKHYRNALIIPAGLVITFNLIYGIFQLTISKDIKSEWLTNDSVFFMSLVMVILNSLFMFCLSLPIFLNKYEKVRQSITLSTLTWFLFPGMWIGFVWKKHLSYLSHSQTGFDGESIFVISNTIPYAIGLIYTFIRFQINERKGK